MHKTLFSRLLARMRTSVGCGERVYGGGILSCFLLLCHSSGCQSSQTAFPVDGPALEIPADVLATNTPSGTLDGKDPQTNTHIWRKAHATMGTLVEVAIDQRDFCAQEDKREQAAASVFSSFDLLENKLSEWRAGTMLARINEQAGQSPAPVDDELLQLLLFSQDVSHKTDGAFDISFAAMWGLWTFGDDNINHQPNSDEVQKRRQLVNWQKIQIDQAAKTVFLPDTGMKIGLGGIGKGYAIDVAVQTLRKQGCKTFLIKAGGDLFVEGNWSPLGLASVGIRDPRAEGAFAHVEVRGAMSTSGDYERFFIDDGVRYHHIIDPRTGYPSRQSRSVTVFAPSSTLADALSKAMFILGPKSSSSIFLAYPQVSAIWITDDNQIVSSPHAPPLLLLHLPHDGL